VNVAVARNGGVAVALFEVGRDGTDLSTMTKAEIDAQIQQVASCFMHAL